MADAELVVSALGCLTRREAEAVLWVAQWKTSWEAGMILGITENTMNVHIANASEKLLASNRAHLVAWAFVQGILSVVPRLSCAILAIACSLDASDAIRSPRLPCRIRRREDASLVVDDGAGERARRRHLHLALA